MRSAVAGSAAGGGTVSGAAGPGLSLPAPPGALQRGLTAAARRGAGARLVPSTSLRNASGEAPSGEGGAAGGSSPTEEPALAFPVSEEQRRELREAFELFDRDGCGVVDVRALKITVRALGCELGKEEMKRIVSQFGKEGSGKLSFKSFLQVVTQKMAEPCVEKEILRAFKVFDCDGTGKISFENLKVVASEVGEDITDEELQEMIDEADVNGDGEVDKQEFLRMLTLTDP
ncbi:caltractin-like [Grus japonensis]|uniref:Caltractin-like n=1 Tax=Grus japonensis TaxID=30415 RepID=A0ABC9XCW4_GRUJA